MLKRIKKILHINEQIQSPSVFDEIESLFGSLNDEILKLKIGEDLVELREQIVEKISEVRKEIKDECGFILPPVEILSDSGIQENEFVISIRGKACKSGFLIPNINGVKVEFYETFKSVVYENLEKLFTNEITEKYIEEVQKKNNWLIWNLTCKLSMTDIKTIMLDIIEKGKSINNINYIFEQIGEMVLSEGKFGEYGSKHNPHFIAKQILQHL